MDNVQTLAIDDIKVQFSKSYVQIYFPAFISRFADQGDEEVYVIKAPFEENGVVEHLWVEVSSYDDSSMKFKGRLVNDPVDLKKHRRDDEVIVSKDDVNDLMIVNGNSFEGGFLASAVDNTEVIPIQD